MTIRAHTAAVVLAAGLGTRFKSAQPKVMHPVAGRTMLGHVLEAIRPLGCAQVVVVVGHQAETVAAEARRADLPGLTTVLQAERRGTGHATSRALTALDEDITDVLVVPGDTPLMTGATLERLADVDPDAEGTLISVEVDDPSGYGRVLREDTGQVAGIVEEADATDTQLGLREVNAGMYRFDRRALGGALDKLDTDNAQGEQYLTDAVEILVAAGGRVTAVLGSAEEVAGVNDRVQLADAARVLRRRALEELMRAGVTVVDPQATYVDVGVEVGRDSVLLPGCLLEGATRVGEATSIGPYSRLVDARVGDRATVAQSVLIEATVDDEATVGPFAYLRPGTRLGRGAKAGTFVELKQTAVGPRSKVPHLTYLGDTTVGRDVNVGAGTITCNYDGATKHPTEIADGAFIGSDTMLVAPVRVGPGAYTGAGSAITRDVPADALAVERAEQRTVEGWAARRRAGRHHTGGEPPDSATSQDRPGAQD